MAVKFPLGASVDDNNDPTYEYYNNPSNAKELYRKSSTGEYEWHQNFDESKGYPDSGWQAMTGGTDQMGTA